MYIDFLYMSIDCYFTAAQLQIFSQKVRRPNNKGLHSGNLIKMCGSKVNDIHETGRAQKLATPIVYICTS